MIGGHLRWCLGGSGAYSHTILEQAVGRQIATFVGLPDCQANVQRVLRNIFIIFCQISRFAFPTKMSPVPSPSLPTSRETDKDKNVDEIIASKNRMIIAWTISGWGHCLNRIIVVAVDVPRLAAHIPARRFHAG